jgi:CheY-like chemotaxis protein
MQESTHQPEERRECVLVVDDDSAARSLLRVYLERAGFAVVEAEDGLDAARVLEAQDVDVVVTDVFMPEQDGIELVQGLRRDRPDLPIVVVSGGDRSHDTFMLRVAEALGAGAVLRKPVRAEELVAAIRRLLDATE